MNLDPEKIRRDSVIPDPKITSNVNWKAMRSSRPDVFYSRVVIVDSRYYGSSYTDRVLHYIPLKEADFDKDLRFCYPVIASHEYLIRGIPGLASEDLAKYLNGEVSHIFHAMRKKEIPVENFASYVGYRKSIFERLQKDSTFLLRASAVQIRYLEEGSQFFCELEKKYST